MTRRLDALKGRVAGLLVWLLGLLPLGAVWRIADLVAAVGWRMNIRAARTTRVNVDLCFPELTSGERVALARSSLRETVRLVAETGLLFHWPERRWRQLLSIRGSEHIKEAQAAGRGVLILVPHNGNWEYLTLCLGKFAVTVLYDPPHLASMDAALRRARERGGMTLVPIDRSGLRAIYRVLTRGRVAALLPDQVPARSAGVYAPFFGHPALTMTLAHRLIQRTRPRVLIATARRTPPGFTVDIRVVADEIHNPRAEVSAAAMNRAIEDVVRIDPTQYQWEYKRFRRQPPDRPDPYRGPA